MGSRVEYTPFRQFTLQNAADATGNGEALVLTDAHRGAESRFTLQITGTFTGTVTFEGTVDGTNWQAVGLINYADDAADLTATAAGIFYLNCAGLLKFRARVSAYSDGNITVKAIAVS
jgi:hypothetical protein